MADSARKRKSSGTGARTWNTKRARDTGRGKKPAAAEPAGQAPGSSSNAAGGGNNASGSDGGAAATEVKGGGRRRNPHGIAPSDVEDEAKPTQRAFQRHIRMACGLLTGDAVLGPADDYIDHYDKRFDEVDDIETHMRAIIAEVKKPNRDAQKRAERLIKDAKVLAKGDGSKPGLYGQIAKDIAMVPAEHIALLFGAVTRVGLKTFHPDVFGPTHSTYNQLHRHLAATTFQTISAWYGYTALNVSITIAQDYPLLCEMYDNFMFGTIKINSRKEYNTPGSLSKAQEKSGAEKRRARLCARRYEQAKSMGYRKPVLRMLKTEAIHSDDERPDGGDARKKKGLLIRTKDGRNPVVTVFLREQDDNILKRLERRDSKLEPFVILLLLPLHCPENSPIGVPIDFFAPQFYNEQLNIHEKAMYINTGVAFPLPKFCTRQHHSDWARMPAKEFMKKYGNDVLKQYNIPTPEELAELDTYHKADGSEGGSTDLEDSDDAAMEV
ncbi:hypothetical protein MSAN_01331700 [Mycena sanguinolenta]|uniref:Uncharacterized protein n=1 Tax=Mycena sanguinolenta TaxID=230812 RepID=A0A8H7D3G7_9AGAR|nr:hypothetical protein MSAN_01331700 [Mycena sanguinolenta]